MERWRGSLRLFVPPSLHLSFPPSPDPYDSDMSDIARAVKILRTGGLVAFPTETVYGLAGNALDSAAVRRIFEAKGRPAHNPLIIHVASIEMARSCVSQWPARATRPTARC